jgi:hypothetical protein
MGEVCFCGDCVFYDSDKEKCELTGKEKHPDDKACNYSIADFEWDDELRLEDND